MTLLGASKELMKSESEIVYQHFLESLKSEETKRNYIYALDAFLSFLQLKNGKEDLSLLIKEQPKDIENAIISYIIYLKKEGYARATINTKIAAVITFFEINDIVLNKRKIHRFMPENVKTVKDRAYTREEIKKILECCNLKYKVIVTLMTSTGCRIGAIADLTLSNLIEIKEEKLHQVFFYAGTKEEYYAFTTPECSKYIKEYLDFRQRCGEKLNLNSPLIRNDFQQDDLLQAENPRSQTTHNFKFQIRKILIQSGVRERITQDQLGSKKKGRKDIAANHGFRKFVHTIMANNKVSPEIREMLLGHSIGLSDAYYRPTEKEMLVEFLKVVNDLTINEENRLRKENHDLKEKDDYQKYIIDKKMKEIEGQNRLLTSKLQEYEKIERESRIISIKNAQRTKELEREWELWKKGQISLEDAADKYGLNFDKETKRKIKTIKIK